MYVTHLHIMETNERQLSGQEHLEIIARMINQALGNVSQGSFHLLLWGWVIMVASLGHFFLVQFTESPAPYRIWFIVIPGILVSFYYGFKKGLQARVRTILDSLYMWIWISFVFCFFLLQLFLSGSMEHFAPYVLMLAGYATLLSGILLKFKPLMVGGFMFWGFAIGAFFSGPAYGLLINGLVVLCGYLIPGYMLKQRMANEAV